ncbi:MAG: hypothetical protein L0226_09700 [Acidobacteria bacterium]|nr:hypothetical protein [Acidobacteriota bacterium]
MKLVTHISATVIFLCLGQTIVAAQTNQPTQASAHHEVIIDIEDGTQVKGRFLRADAKILEVENDSRVQQIEIEKVDSIKFVRARSISSTAASSLTSPRPTSAPNARTESKPTDSSRESTSYRTYIRGPRGGCYYINSNGNKTYVSQSYCK